MTPTEAGALKEWARESARRCMAEGSTLSEGKFEQYLLEGVRKGMEAAKVKVRQRAVLDALPEDELEVAVHRFGAALVEDIAALLKDLKERTT